MASDLSTRLDEQIESLFLKRKFFYKKQNFLKKLLNGKNVLKFSINQYLFSMNQ